MRISFGKARWVLFLVVIHAYSAQAQSSNNEINFQAIDNYIESKMRLPRIPGMSVAVVKDDQIVYLKGYGEADPSGRPMTPQTPLIIGSITKAFTALAVMQLVEAGKVELDAPVQKYIPWFRTADANASARITVRQLLNQRSGLPMLREPQFWNDQSPHALERAVRLLENKSLDYPPGQGYSYSNANYDTLGLLVQMVSGQAYEEYVKLHVFAPLEMKDSFASQDEAERNGMAQGHRWWYGVPVAVRFPQIRAELPAGYLISSAEDMAHFIIAEMNGGRFKNSTVLSDDGIALTQTPPAANTYAMGWLESNENGHRVIFHDGGTGHFETSVFFDPDARVGVFVGMNVMSALDAFSSPPGPDPLDGVTVRAVAQNVLSLATNRPLPEAGFGILRLYLVFDLVLLSLTAILIASLFRTRTWYRRLRERGIANSSSFWRGGILVVIKNFTMPLLLVIVMAKVFFWKVLAMLQPDLTYWLQAVAVVLILKGVLQMALIARVCRGSSAKA